MGSLGRVGLRKVAATGGEVNSGVNVGVGVGKIFKDKPALDLRFKSILAGAGITINDLTDEVEIVAAGGSGSYNLARLEGVLISTNRAALNWLDSSKINFTVTDDGPSDETEITATIIALSLVNGDISVSAAIEFIKMQALTANRALATNGSGVITVSAVTNTELNLLDGRVATLVSTGAASIYGVFEQRFRDNTLTIRTPDVAQLITLRTTNLAADRDVIVPALLGNDTILFENHIATMIGKTFDVSLNTFLSRIALINMPLGTAFQRTRTNSGATDVEQFTEEAALVFTIGDGVAVISTGVKMHIRVPFDLEVTRWTLLAKQSGSIVCDVNRFTSLANFDADTKASITGTDTPDLVADRGDESTALTGWTTVLSQGDILEVEVDSATTITRVTLVLRVNKRG